MFLGSNSYFVSYEKFPIPTLQTSSSWKMRFCMLVVPKKLEVFSKIVEALVRTYCLDGSISSLQLICWYIFIYFCVYVVAMVTIRR